MNRHKFIRKLKRYLKRHKSLTKPKLVLDWVNTEGWESEIYAYTLNHGSRSNCVIEQGVMRLLTGADFSGAQSEFHTLSLLHRAGYPVPEVYALGSPKDGFKHPFILMQRVEGGNFANRFPKSPQDDLKPLRDFIGLFRSLHTLDWRPYVDSPEEIAPSGQPYFHFDRNLDKFSQYIERSGLKALDPVMAWLEDRRETTACDRASVVHWDFHPNNILEDNDGKLFVVDWTSAEISDYRFDLAWTLALTLAYGGNTRREMVLSEYERQMGSKVPGLDVFEVVAGMRRIGSGMISMLISADKMGMRPEAAEIMRRDQVAFERIFQHLTALTGLELPEISAWIDTLG